jgi:hypothetical protein
MNRQKAQKRGNLLPFHVIEAAASGDTNAINEDVNIG